MSNASWQLATDGCPYKLLSHLTCRSPALNSEAFLLSAVRTGTGGRFWLEGFVKVREAPASFAGARASDVTSVGSRQLRGR